MKQRGTRELFAYWNALRRSRSAPNRDEIDPAAIRDLLADTFMLEVDTAQRFPFRTSGTRVNAIFDAEQRQRSFLDLWAPQDAHSIAALLLTVVDGVCPIVVGVRGHPDGEPDIDFELLLLPLRHHGKTHSRILGRMAPGQTPSWLGLMPVTALSLVSLRVVGSDEFSAIFGRDAGPAPLAVVPPATPLERRAQLRVYQGGR